MNRSGLRTLITRSLRSQGFRVSREQIRLPKNLDKQKLRGLNELAVKHRVSRSERGLRRHEDALLKRLACGSEVAPSKIAPRLVEVRPGTDDELLFRYASLHWSIPVSSGYGRRLRFLVLDDQNGKLIGLFGLSDPVFNLAGRDAWIGWNSSARINRLQYVMDAFILGAVPPYSYLLCGKLIAMMVACNEVRAAFARKYGERRSIIRGKRLDGRLALVTTISAFGRSSIYNRVSFHGRLLFRKAGFTRGSGEFHFSNGLYSSISGYARRYCEPTAKKEPWGRGFRNRREVVKKCLAKIGISTEWIYHGIQREIFVVPSASNSREFLRGEHSRLRWFDHPSSELSAFFRDRWLIPRSLWDFRYRAWDPEQWRLWNRA